MNRLLEIFFERRGIPPDDLYEMSRVGTVDLPGLDDACARLKAARDGNKRVVLFTDFDMDGIMSSVVGYAGLCDMGFLVSLYPSDPKNGYGMHESDIDGILEAHPDAEVLLTGDVGIGEEGPIAYASGKGLEVIVTDHHAGTVPPSCSVCVDPMLGADWSFKGICGAHVMYLLLRRFAQLYCGPFSVRQMDRLRVFAGIATVADSMPVYHENRGIIMDAVNIMRMLWASGDQTVANMIDGCDVYRRAMLGLYVLCEAFKEDRKLSDGESINETFFGFYLVPTFNSLKRMDAGLETAYDVFFGGKERAESAVRDLLELNRQRKLTVADAEMKMFHGDPQPLAPYVYRTDASPGIRGLLAQKGIKSSGVPTVVIGAKPGGGFIGSGRAPAWFKFLDETADLPGVHPAGHQGAFGVTVDSWKDAEDLYKLLDARVREVAASGSVSEDSAEIRISTIDSCADTDVDVDLFFDFLRELDSYRPFGPGFREPSFELEFRPSDARWSVFGNGAHVKAVLPMGFSVMWFSGASGFKLDGNGQVDVDALGNRIAVRGTMGLNKYMGNESVQFLVR